MGEKRDNTRSAVFMGWVLTIFLDVIFLGYGTSDFPDFSWSTILILTPINFIAVCLTYLLLFYDGSKIEISDCPCDNVLKMILAIFPVPLTESESGPRYVI